MRKGRALHRRQRSKMAAWRKAEGAFRGELLPQLAGEVWVMRAARALRAGILPAPAPCAPALPGENAYGELWTLPPAHL